MAAGSGTSGTKSRARTNGTSASLRDRIRASEVKAGKPYEVKEWGAKLDIRSLTVKKKNALADADENPDGFVSDVLIACCYDPKTGEPVFTEEDDAAWLCEQPANVIEPLLFVALRQSGMSDEDLAEAIEEGKGGS